MIQQIQMTGVETDDYNYNEALKTLRTNLQFCGSNLKKIMFSSAMPDEGKSNVTMGLACSMAQIDKKILLIDADIRKSVMTSRYQISQQTSGLSQYLSGQKNLEEILYHTNIKHMDIILAGPYSPNPAELLEEELFDTMLEQCGQDYDYILIDTPPMANLIDGAIIAGKCDGAVLVVENGAVSRNIVQRVKQQIEKSGCRILGVILNKTDLDKGGYYNRYYGTHKRYGKYYRHDG